MEKYHYYHLVHFPLALILSCLLSSASSAVSTTNISTDQSALLALRSQFSIKSHQFLLKNWSIGSSVCDWIGVACGARHRRVTALNITNMGLNGLIPPQLGNLSFLQSLDMSRNNFSGKLPEQLARLRRLQVLNLGFNNLNGVLPPWFGSFHELQFLSLANNSFTGFIPSSIYNMSNLETLRLSYNLLQGQIPKEIFNMSSLELIALDDNRLSGSIPDYMCEHLQRLNWISLSSNYLNGRIPSTISQCSELQKLSLSLNQFSGGIPKDIWTLKKLDVLYLGRNSLEGKIPEGVGNSTRMMSLDFSENNLTGEIPPEFSYLVNLEQLNLGWNKFTGSIPLIFNFSMLQTLSFSTNELSGNLPSMWGYGLPNLEELYLDDNNITGAIPDSISNSSNLSIMILSQNKFTGSIPNSLGHLLNLEILGLDDNELTGTDTTSSPWLGFITSLTNCKYLRTLSLSQNPLNGILPDSFGNLSTSLEKLYANSCKIRGNIPNGIGNLRSLILLSLSHNELTGPLPGRMKDLINLQELSLFRNKLSKGLQNLCLLKNLGHLNLRNNRISGPIPECLGDVTSLRQLYLNSNRFNSTPPENLWNLKDLLELDLSSNLLSGPVPPQIQNLKMATLIDLSVNNFSGGIPSSIGEMENLITLSLAHNSLQGSIPESTGKMLSLQSLDLSHNFLSGLIPMSLENLRYLTYFNVSFNNLNGEIPPGGPFMNFTGEFFISNGALCGAQRFHVPPCSSNSGHKSKIKKVHKILFISLGVTFIIAVGTLLLGFVYLRNRGKDKVQNGEGLSLVATHERISYHKLAQATDGYSKTNLLGTGSFGSVYKGIFDDGRVVAIKVFNFQHEGAFKSFDTECEVLRNLRHRNITKVISSCSNNDFKALVLEFMPNGSLEKWLYSDNYSLDLIQRLDILIDVACALQYLHFECSTPVVHCDLKPNNVLLDQTMVAHVSDFGIAKLLGHEDSITYTKTLATLCYLAPEYGLGGLVSTKCDVYSFGIMIMEVFTRMSPNNEMFGENLNLKNWVKDYMPNGLAQIIDANLVEKSDDYFLEKLDCISSIMKVAQNCTMDSPKERSNIQDVLVALKKIKLQLQPYTQKSSEGLKDLDEMT